MRAVYMVNLMLNSIHRISYIKNSTEFYAVFSRQWKLKQNRPFFKDDAIRHDQLCAEFSSLLLLPIQVSAQQARNYTYG